MPAMSKKKSKVPSNVIAQNRRARFDYNLLDTFEAGVALMGWEVKSLRAGNVQLTDTYVFLRYGEAFLVGAQISPLETASTHVSPEPMRTRKLLLKQRELARLFGGVNREGYTCIPTAMYWNKKGLAKLEVGLGKGKQSHDKRAATKDREWKVNKQRIMRQTNR